MRMLMLVTVGLTGCVIGDGSDATPIRFEAGAPSPVAFEPGRIVHDVCIAVDDESGYIRPVLLIDDGAMGPGEGAPVRIAPIGELDCPEGPDWTGWARLEWRTRTGRGAATVEHAEASGPAGTADVTGVQAPEAPAGELLLDGERFAGYDVVVEAPTAAGPALSVPVVVDYRAAGALAAAPAEGVPLAISLLPAGPVLLGSSSGGVEEPIVTDPDGRVYLFLDAASLDCGLAAEYAIFVTPTGGGTTLAGTLPCTL